MHFLDFLLYFALMNQSQKFELICGVLAETDWNVHFTVTFDDVCRRYGADPRRMDNMFYDRFGMSGEEMIEQYRKGCLVF